MYWLSQEDPIYQYNLMQASFYALDQLFGSEDKKSSSEDNGEAKVRTGSQRKSRNNGGADSPGFLGRIWGLIPSKV
ncbi:MAG TPA: hypothetical protein PKY35_08210 [Candidatus Hydrogenedentes bacterium]|nr:hypothetical protein [Candidatus Hydrogenedentota bacterium]HOL76997.1 hypothetical protein [Candidatus Hydrogenedentota bacterium]HPO85820.1 hypothetical protein [Candidatus Hydrogenedentota bacterium]